MKKEILTPKDIETITAKGISQEQVFLQLERFAKGATPVNPVKPATPGDGITCFKENKIKELVAFFEKAASSRTIIKFVPASGAATRMFKDLQNYLNNSDNQDNPGAKEDPFIQEFISGIKNKDFAFLEDLQKVLEKDGFRLEELVESHQYVTIIEYLLHKGLNYANLPKALLKFHYYKDHGYSRTAIEEHLVEGLAYSRDAQNEVHIHFTISPGFLEKMNKLLEAVIPRYTKGDDTGAVTFDISHSFQQPATDTVAVDKNNELFRDGNGNIVLRPGGHGALIKNLDDLDGDIIFIKNIDNIVPDHLKAETITFKKVIGGHLLTVQSQVFDFLSRLDPGGTGSPTPLAPADLDNIVAYAQEGLNITFPAEFENWEASTKSSFLFKKLNRPIRVCGMVKNEGEPGGGPFWIKEKDGAVSLQIIEGAQLDKDSAGTQQMLAQATHFNPVDLVCAVKDYRGQKFVLSRFVDHEAYFISAKSLDGRPLKAMELPGLWNGAMADWNTIFVEVPLITFNPVKTVNDLLRPTHI